MSLLRVEKSPALSGEITVNGAKNAVLPILAATVLTASECRILDVPSLKDVEVMESILTSIGARVAREGGHRSVRADNLTTHEIPTDLTRQMRSSVFLMGPMLARLGEVRMAYPGGCAIGPRPIDLHLSGLRAMGAEITERYGFIEARANRLTGTEIHLDFPSVGATENIMMAAVLAEGTTVIGNAAKEPEIVDLQNFLNAMGARVRGAGMDTIRIDGVAQLGGAEHALIPDRIEAGTFLVAAVLTGGELLVKNSLPEHLESVMAKLREAGARLDVIPEGVMVRGPRRVCSVDVKTLPYPGFPTDMQPQMMVLMTVADGTSVITETVFENRFSQAEELRRMGAQIKVEGKAAVVKGVESLSGAQVKASDLRSGAALVLAGLVAEGETVIDGLHHLDRGYYRLEERLRSVGARIFRQ